ncbi:hypothetical protein JG687_00013253 [Phytophthora cactorum]|uniref:HBS1-like protein n=1 Tax=Phytophthora cactorum TaxID=29920 RepID=A0A8T1U355_9STRA|nr:hypothetical protein JG687_00013253 [Phytophthora cactorum]
MSRHRNVRNRAYSNTSFLFSDYDEYYDDYEPSSPNNEFMYRRDSPSRQRSVFSFVQQEETEQEPTSDPGDAEILEAMVPQVQQAVGSRFSSHQITQELRSANYDLDKTVVALLEKGKAPAAAGGVLPLQIQIPRLEAVALAIGNEVQTESKPKKEIVMPAPAKGKAMAIGALPSTPKKAEEEKKPRISAADAVNAAPAISRAQTQFTPAEKKAFERAELKTQEQAVKLEEEARTGGKTKISMVVIGHVDAGKSTITGHLLYKLGGMTGANLEKTGGVEECSWYSGPSLVEAIDTFAPPQRQISKPFRMTVSDVSKSMSLGQTISGRVYAGAAAVGDSFLLMPIGLPLTVKGMEQDGKSCTLARAGDTIEMGITGIDPSALTTGSILCSIASPVQLAKKFEAKIMTMPAVEVPLVKGTYVTIHMHNVDEPVNITRLVSMLSKTGEVEKKKPRCITRERSAVVQITCHRKICLEEFANYRQLGRFTLRDRGKTLAAGIITQIIA